jgi:hypothetical protein
VRALIPVFPTGFIEDINWVERWPVQRSARPRLGNFSSAGRFAPVNGRLDNNAGKI